MKFFSFKRIAVMALIVSGLVLTGCASIVNGTSQEFKVTSKPDQAELMVDGVSVGSTPKKINLARKDKHVLKLKLAGYEPENIHLEQTTSGWLFGNILFGGIIGIAIDASNGAMYELTPQELGSKVRYTSETKTILVMLVKKAGKNWRKMGSLKKVAN